MSANSEMDSTQIAKVQAGSEMMRLYIERTLSKSLELMSGFIGETGQNENGNESTSFREKMNANISPDEQRNYVINVLSKDGGKSTEMGGDTGNQLGSMPSDLIQ